MEASTYQDILELDRMTIGELKSKYRQVFGEDSRSNHTGFLRKRITWRIQALAEGDLSERAKQRAAELANDADLRIRMPRAGQRKENVDSTRQISKRVPRRNDIRLPLPGTLLVREYQGKDIVVKVLRDGFEYDGNRYASLSTIAREVTGTKWNGYLFFRLLKPGEKIR